MVNKGDIIRLYGGSVFIVTAVDEYSDRLFGIFTDGSTYEVSMSKLNKSIIHTVIGHTDRLDNILYIIKNLDGALKCLERA